MSGGPGVAARAAGFASRLARAGRALACLGGAASVCLALLLGAVSDADAQVQYPSPGNKTYVKGVAVNEVYPKSTVFPNDAPQIDTVPGQQTLSHFGLSFDVGTRTMSGTPTRTGSSEFWYAYCRGGSQIGGEKFRITVIESTQATSATVNGRTLTITFDKTMSTTAATSVPPANRFRYTRGDGRIPHIPKSVAVSGSDVTLTLRHTVQARETVTVGYVAPNANPRLQDSSNNPVLSFSLALVTNETPDVVVPTVVEAYVPKTGQGVALFTSESMRNTFGGETSQFTVKVNGASRSLTRILQPTFVNLGLNTPVTAGQSVTVSYSGTGWVDVAGNRMAAFTDMPVENRVPANATIQKVEITSTPSYDADGDGTVDTYRKREDINITVTFDKDVTWTYPSTSAVLQVRLRVGSGTGSAKAAKLVTDGASRGTARALTFRYRVAGTDADTDGVSVEPVSGSLIRFISSPTLKAADGGFVTVTHAGLVANANHKADATRVDSTKPTVVSRTLDGNKVTITYNERLREASVPGTGRFTVNAGGTVQTVRSMSRPSPTRSRTRARRRRRRTGCG